jgi:tRNA(Leu) C34 or U34 (ribose-2'-O)-methylase TrmL
MNVVLLEPKNRENLATILRSGQNFGVNTVFVIGGFIRESYKGNIHKFSHQMNTQDGISAITLMYFDSLEVFLAHLPAQTTLVIVETFAESQDLRTFVHPVNATYMLGRETSGISLSEKDLIESHFGKLHEGIPKEYLGKHTKTAYLQYVKIETPQSLNMGVCGSIVMYDRHFKSNVML